MCGLYRLALAFAISSFFSCSQTLVEKYPSEAVISAQESTLKKLHQGQDKAEVLSLLQYPVTNFFEVNEGGKYFSYVAVINPSTRASFGFLYEDEKLQFLIVDGDVQDFFACRSMFKTNGEHWLSFGVAPYREWLKDHDRLDGGFNYRLAKPQVAGQSKLASGIETASTAIVYAPILLMVSPFIAKDYISGKYQEDAEKRKSKRELSKERAARVGGVIPGVSESQMIAELGPASYIIEVDGAQVFVYNDFSSSFAVKNNVIVWREHISMFELHARQIKYGNGKAFYSDVSCGKLDAVWQEKK